MFLNYYITEKIGKIWDFLGFNCVFLTDFGFFLVEKLVYWDDKSVFEVFSYKMGQLVFRSKKPHFDFSATSLVIF